MRPNPPPPTPCSLSPCPLPPPTTLNHVLEQVHCHHCNQQITTRVDKVIGLGNNAGCLLCCCLGGWYGCCLIPYCIDDFKDTVHSCPICENLLGRNGPFAIRGDSILDDDEW